MKFWLLDRMYLTRLENFQGSFPHTKTRKKFIPKCVREQWILELQTARSLDHNSLDFYLWGHLNTPGCSAPIEIKGHLADAFCSCLSNHFQPTRDFWKGVTDLEQMCPCMHWYSWKAFSAFIVSCDLISSNNWNGIKFGTWVLNVLC